ADVGLGMAEVGLADGALLVEEMDDALLALDDLARLRRAVGELGHVAERHALDAERAAALVQPAHRARQRQLEVGEPVRGVAVGLGAAHRRIEVVPHEVLEEREALAEAAHVLVEVIGVELVDDGVDVDRRRRRAEALERLHGERVRALDAGEEVFELLAARVDADVEVAQARGHVLLGEAGLGQARAVGDHADVQPALDGVARDLGDELGQRRLAAGEDDAEVAARDEVVDLPLGRRQIEDPAARWIGAEAAVLDAVADDLHVAEVGHQGLPSPPPARSNRPGKISRSASPLFFGAAALTSRRAGWTLPTSGRETRAADAGAVTGASAGANSPAPTNDEAIAGGAAKSAGGSRGESSSPPKRAR